MFQIASSSKSLTSSPDQYSSAKRPHPTWPTNMTTRTHFEDFLQEIGVSAEAQHLCCVPRQGHISEHHAPGHKASTPPSATKVSSGHPRQCHRRRPEVQGASHSDRSSRREKESSMSSALLSEGGISRMSIVHPIKIDGYPRSLKTKPLWALDMQNHAGSKSYDSSISAQESLRSLLEQSHDEQRSPHATATIHRMENHIHVSSPSVLELSRDAPSMRSTRSRSRSPSSDSLATASSSEAPETPRAHSILHEVRPTLVDLEYASRFRVHAVCVTCSKTGANFPSCARCGEMWCSRDCRLKGNSGSRHACQGRVADSQRCLTAHTHPSFS
ncbi:hypothetical protein AcV5_007711 [Taiwanofungus camphoratus]|nr:hypothetical protein AcW2_007376 [Antrodia cinnamomea]KAI0927079.1 hypothetical protein AcV5_007711 [Antrodia cinnamomea]KAI0947313.1 hypothetical protein AcV7_009769 [Antrodia cinnamomea]